MVRRVVDVVVLSQAPKALLDIKCELLLGITYLILFLDEFRDQLSHTPGLVVVDLIVGVG